MEEESNTMVEKNSRLKNVSAETSSETLNVIRPYGYSVSKCGYCKGSRSNLFQENESASPHPKSSSPSHSTKPSASKSSLASKSYSVLADRVSPRLYEGLINMGWRRSGLHLYKPQNFSSCCPTLTTRLLTQEFTPSKSQRKVLKKMEKILGSLQGPTRQRKEESVSFGTMGRTATPSSTPTFTSKKQKRNHGKRQNFSRPDVVMHGMASSMPLSVEEEVFGTGILQRLEIATTNAIEKYFSSSIQCNAIARQNSKEYNWKTRYRILTPSKRERKRSQVRAVSSICAQICGQLSSSFATNSSSREQFVEYVVQAIRTAEESLIVQDVKNDNGPAIPSNHRKVSIISIEAHQASGQISCTMEVEKANPESYKEFSTYHNQNDNDAEMNESVSREHDKSYQKDRSGITCDKLAQWYEKTTGKQLDPEPNKRCITIETLPSHQSALHPDVHKLYALYQHVVHGDPNPFAYDPNAENMNVDSDESDDEDEEPKIDTDNPSELDWGDAPPSFTSKISAMLTSYIQPLDSMECRRALLSNYHSFYQFLVEAPFSLHNPCLNNMSTPINDDQGTQQMPGLVWDTNIDNSSSKLPCGLYHQHYRIGGELLIAVGVIDILPTGLSSVYLFYHPSFSSELVALGKYAILKEIEFARDVLNVPYYYLGYYIESCQKMRYKADYKPTQILCPKYYKWVDASIAISKLQMTLRHVCPLVEPVPTQDEEKESNGIVNRNSNIEGKSSLRRHNDTARAVNMLQMDVGAGLNVTIDMLHPSGVEVVKPILEDFVSEFSPALSKQCILKLN